MRHKKIILVNDISELNKVARVVEDLGEKWLLDARIVFDINLVLEEMVTNIIFYAYDDEKQHEIVIDVKKEKQMITIHVHDDGKPFDPSKFAEPDDLEKPLEERKIGGLGIYLVRKLMDDVEYQRKGNMNILTLSKKL